MHASVMTFAKDVLNADLIAGKTVLEVGSRNVNGSVRQYVMSLNPQSYIGVDIIPGPGVDELVDCAQLSTSLEGSVTTFDVVISTEMMEHAEDWRTCMEEMAKVLNPGGLLFLTTRSPGFDYHNPPDHWRYTMDDMYDILTVLDLEPLVTEPDPIFPGVFILARKPEEKWRPTPSRLKFIEVYELGPGAGRNERVLNGQQPPVDGSKIVLGFPLYQTIPVSWFFRFTQMDKSHLVGTVATKGVYLNLAMEKLTQMAFDNIPEWDWLLVWEHDIIPPLNALNHVAAYDTNKYDIVSGTVFRHEYPYHIMAWMHAPIEMKETAEHPVGWGPPAFCPLTSHRVKELVDNPGLYPVDAVPMGFTAIARHVLEDWNPEIPMWTPTPPLAGHDLHFCNEAKKQGWNVHLDSGLGLGHLTEVPIGYENAQAALAEAEPETWEQLYKRNGDITEIPEIAAIVGK